MTSTTTTTTHSTQQNKEIDKNEKKINTLKAEFSELVDEIKRRQSINEVIKIYYYPTPPRLPVIIIYY